VIGVLPRWKDASSDNSLYFHRLIVQVSDLGLFLVTGIIWCAGLIMFLLPPRPGVPVYLTIGVVLPAQGYEQLGVY
jgi:hypothetical protein